jgi:hypothetical protein
MPDTKHYFIEWNWWPEDAGRFSSEADMTPDEAVEIERNLKERADKVGDIECVEVYPRTLFHQDVNGLRREIVEALDNACLDCFAPLGDDPGHVCRPSNRQSV